MIDTNAMAAQAQALVLAGKLDEAAPLFEDGARRLATEARHAEAAAAFLAAARLRGSLGDHATARALLAECAPSATAAGLELDLLRARAELAEQSGDPSARESAWLKATRTDDADLQVLAWFQLSQLAKEADEPIRMATLLDKALAAAEPLGVTEQIVEVLLEQAVAYTAGRRLDRAEAALTRADEMLGEDAPLPLRARVRGQQGVLAASRGDADSALGLAMEARAFAVACSDVATYLAAAQLITMCQEALGRPALAYDAILRAQSSLGDLLGDEGRALVQPALEAFTLRHAEPKMTEIHEAWVAMKAQQN